ncbi:class I SAM-dependent methyltransferase [Arsenophonus endosymbiont of Aleurodicus floccissimus]|nr:class I SAM-dependent methyltransferase [Arsenophonus endosymbiont of Aleurodicus floccissimus]
MIGTDISQKMLKVAKAKNRFSDVIEYRQQAKRIFSLLMLALIWLAVL